MVSPHNADFNDSLGAVRAQLERRGGFDIKFISRRDIELSGNPFRLLAGAFRFFFLSTYRLATARYVFLNDNFMPLAYINPSEKTTVVQLWHAQGVFKRFGLCSPLSAEVEQLERRCCERYTYAVCSSKQVVPYYAQAFNLPQERVLPLGSPRCDRFFEDFDAQKLRRDFDSLYPQCKGKKLVMYAPTFRDDPERDARIMGFFDTERFERELSDEYALLVRLHPQIHSGGFKNGEYSLDVTDFKDAGSLVQLADLLITDYSSICMEFALLGKPCLFYAFDLQEYERERSFFFDYESYVPGTVVKSFDALLQAVKEKDFTCEKQQEFREFNFDYFDNLSAERVVDEIIK